MKLPVMAAEHLSQLQAFEAKILCNHAKIEAWFRSQWNAHHPPFYGSVDISEKEFHRTTYGDFQFVPMLKERI